MQGNIIEKSPAFTTFYEIPGAPGIGIKRPIFGGEQTGLRIFVQSTSQGSRCLKKGIMLYKVAIIQIHNFMYHNNYRIHHQFLFLFR